MNNYEWWPVTNPLIPPIGGLYKFFSVAIICQQGKGQISHDIGEVHGKTKEEAEQKLTEKVKQWIDKH